MTYSGVAVGSGAVVSSGVGSGSSRGVELGEAVAAGSASPPPEDNATLTTTMVATTASTPPMTANGFHETGVFGLRKEGEASVTRSDERTRQLGNSSDQLFWPAEIHYMCHHHGPRGRDRYRLGSTSPDTYSRCTSGTCAVLAYVSPWYTSALGGASHHSHPTLCAGVGHRDNPAVVSNRQSDTCRSTSNPSGFSVGGSPDPTKSSYTFATLSKNAEPKLAPSVCAQDLASRIQCTRRSAGSG